MSLSPSLAELLRTADAGARLADLVTRAMDLHEGEVLAAPPTFPRRGRRDELARLAREGHLELATAVRPGDAGRLARALDAVLAEGLPGVFLYVSEPAWALGAQLTERLSALLGLPYCLLADAWAWRIEPGARGWPPHRGWSESVLDATAPELLNVWVALSDATAERSCMFAVPLADDPRYPSELGAVDAPLEATVALPIPAGAALVWNANLLHWGGPCARYASAPRYSVSFSLARVDQVARRGWEVVTPGGLSGVDRVELVAAQIATYGAGKPDVAPEVLAWARATCAFRHLQRA